MAKTKDVSAEAIRGVTQRYAMGIKIILFLVVAVILTVVVLKIVRAFKKPANAEYVVGGGDIPSGWTPTQITKDIFDMIDSVFMSVESKQDVLKRFNALTDNQMIAVYNEWNDKGYDEEKKYFITPLGSLTNALKEKFGYWAFGMNQQDLAIQNLERLKLH